MSTRAKCRRSQSDRPLAIVDRYSHPPRCGNWRQYQLGGLAGLRDEALCDLHSLAADLLDLVAQLLLPVELRNLVAAADTDAGDQDIWHRFPACHFCQPLLDLLSQGMQVELDYERRGFDVVLL